MAPELENQEKENLKWVAKHIGTRFDLTDFSKQKYRYEPKTIVFASGFFTLLSFLFSGLFIWLNILLLIRLFDYNREHKNQFIDHQVKTLLATTTLVGVTFLAAGYTIPEIITIGEYVKTVVIG